MIAASRSAHEPGTGVFRYTRCDRALTELTYTVWNSTDLLNWTEDHSPSQLPGEPGGNGVLSEDVTLPELLVNPSLFHPDARQRVITPKEADLCDCTTFVVSAH